MSVDEKAHLQLILPIPIQCAHPSQNVRGKISLLIPY